MMLKQKNIFVVTSTLMLFLGTSIAPATPCHAAELASFPLIPHHAQKARHLKEQGINKSGDFEDTWRKQDDNSGNVFRRAEAVQTAALYHGYGTHYVDLWCGTPPQRQTVIVDTGSSITAFPCSDCDQCGAGTYHVDNLFREDDSTTFSMASCNECEQFKCSDEGQCILHVAYDEDSSWKAFQARDRCYIGGPHNEPLVDETSGKDMVDPEHANAFTIDLDFGCQTKVTILFKTQLADGIMGMEDSEFSFWSQMFESGKGGKEKQFSLCYTRPEQADREGTEAGAMTLGGTDTRLHESPMVYAKRLNQSGYYKVHVRKLFLRHGEGGESAQSSDHNAKAIPLDVNENELNKHAVIVDSGTTDTYFSSKISSQFRAVFQELSGMSFDQREFALEARELATLPTILVQLEGDMDLNKQLGDDPSQIVGLAGDLDAEHPYDIIVAVPPSHYMELGSGGKYFARVHDTDATGGVLGANTMMGHDVLFDIDNQVVGWAESHCDYHGLVTENGFVDPLSGPAYSGSAHTSPGTSSEGATSDSLFPKEAIETELHEVKDACGSWYCRGSLLAAVFGIFCIGCCLGRCCRNSRSVDYKPTEESGSFKDDQNEQSYQDEPLDDSYAEFELT